MVRAGKNEHMKTWRHSVPYNSASNIADRNADNKENTTLPHTPSDNEIEYMEVDDLDCKSQLSNSSIVSTNTSIVSSKELLSLKYNEDIAKPIFPRQRTEKKSSMCDSENERNDNKLNNYQELKNKIRPLIPERPIKMENSRVYFKLFFLILLATVVILVSILLHEDQNQRYNNDFTNAIVELRKRIHGQDQALRDLHEYLSLDAPLFKVIALVGGTGTGKTYTVEIIKKNFPRAQSVHQYFPPIGLTINDIALSILHPSLIILENLKEHDLPDVVKFLRSYQDLRNHQHITVLTVFNVEQIDNYLTRNIDLDQSLMAIKNIFASESIDVKVISYESLTEDVLIKCIVDAARDSNLILSDNQIDLVKQNLLLNNAGCKGAYSKVQVIGRQ